MKKLKGFTPTFWVANVIELFERFAYYGSKAILAVFVADQVGLGPEKAGWLVGSLFNGLLYFLPILAGTVVDRYGFKKSLLACFSIFCLGYFLIGLGGLPAGKPLVVALGAETYMILALLVTAVGGSLIKPSIVGTVARTTDDKTKSLGYSIYYTLVNIGGAVGPILALQVRENLGISYVLVMSSLVSFLLFASTVIFFSEPPRPKDAAPAKSMAGVLGDMLTVFLNLRFMAFLVIFSGFWIMFWQEFIALPLFIRGYVNPEADVDLLTTVDPLAVILLQILISYLTRKVRPFGAMTAGILITSLSWLILAVADLGWQINTTLRIGSWSVPIQGLPVYAMIALVILAIGEMVQSPRYYEYVSRLAPPGQQGTFMGFSFLPIAIGFVIAGSIGGRLVNYFGEVRHRPEQLWYVIAGIGVLTTLLMWIYDKAVRPGKA